MGCSAANDWVLDSGEPWTRYRALLDLEHLPADSPAVQAARKEMIASEPVQGLVARAAEWPGYPLRRHNDAAHPLYALATLADFGVRRTDPGIDDVAGEVMAHFDGAGFQTLLSLPRFLTKEDDAEAWAWMLCDAPTLLYALLGLGYGSEPTVEQAVAALASRVEDNGWRCGAADALPRFSGPGGRADTCPMATIYALKALSLVPGEAASPAVHAGVAAILDHWEYQREYKLRMFGIGTEFRKLRYPFVWYDILHVTDVLSRFEHARGDPRLAEMWAGIAAQGDDRGRFTAGAMYRSWQGWSFADKRSPSPWLTLLALRIADRIAR